MLRACPLWERTSGRGEKYLAGRLGASECSSCAIATTRRTTIRRTSCFSPKRPRSRSPRARISKESSDEP
jgi:hypothetical protein